MRLGEVEKVQRARAKHLGLRAFVGERSAVTSTADFSRAVARAAGGRRRGAGARDRRRPVQRPARRRPSWRRAIPELDLYDPDVGDGHRRAGHRVVQGRPRRRRWRPTRASPTPRAPSSTRGSRSCVVYASSHGFQRRVSQLELLADGGAGGLAERRDAARLLVHACSASWRSWRRPPPIGRKAAERALRRLGRAPGRDLRGAGGLRSRHGRQPAAPSRRRGVGQRPLQGHCRSSPASSAQRIAPEFVTRRTTTARCPAGWARSRSTARACRRGARRSSSAACSPATSSTPTRPASCRAAVDRQRRALGRPTRRTSARPTSILEAGDDLAAGDHPLGARAGCTSPS